jgi:hypothetical protein
MRKLALITVAGLVAAGAIAALGLSSEMRSPAQPSLRVIDRSPFTVQGRHFRSRERVKVTLAKDARVRTRRVTASGSGVFSAAAPEVAVDRCDTIMVRAVGSAGSRAQLKLLPQPACRST